MSNAAPITLEQLFRYVKKNQDGTFALPHQAAAIPVLEADIRDNGYAVAMRRDRPWFQTWSQAGKQPNPSPPIGPQEWATRIQALNLSQPDSQTCQATCIAMAVGDRDIAGIRNRLTGIGSAGDPAVMSKVIRQYRCRYEYAGNACLEDVYGWLRNGELLITHGWFTRSGHVICLDGLRQVGSSYQLNVKDPWSEFNAASWSYDQGSRFYDGFYSDLLIYATCVAGISREDARAVYRVGVVDPQRRGMWVHRFIP